MYATNMRTGRRYKTKEAKEWEVDAGYKLLKRPKKALEGDLHVIYIGTSKETEILIIVSSLFLTY